MSWLDTDMGAHKSTTSAHLTKRRVMAIMASSSRADFSSINGSHNSREDYWSQADSSYPSVRLALPEARRFRPDSFRHSTVLRPACFFSGSVVCPLPSV